MEDPKRPGVYIEEIALLPPSVVGVSTAVPAFLGYTQIGSDYINIPKRISSMLEFTTLFGGPPTLEYEIDITGEEPDITDFHEDGRKFFLYYAVKMFFQYGDSPCYIISTGLFKDGNGLITDLDPNAFDQALVALEKEDEPTLIVFPEATKLGNDFYTLCDKALMQCERLKDRFVIIDVIQKEDVAISKDEFRNSIGNNNLKYGAAYFPYLDTVLRYAFDEETVKVNNGIKEYKTGLKGLRVAYHMGDDPTIVPKIEIKSQEINYSGSEGQLVIEGVGDGVVASAINLPSGSDFNALPLNGGSELVQESVKRWGFLIGADPAAPALAITSTKKDSVLTFSPGESIAFETKSSSGKEELTITLPEAGAMAATIVEEWIKKINDPTQEFNPLGFYVGYLGNGEETIPSSVEIPEPPKVVYKTSDNGLLFTYAGTEENPSVTIKRLSFDEDSDVPKLTISGVGQGFSAWEIELAWGKRSSAFHLEKIGDGSQLVKPLAETNLSFAHLAAYKTLETAKYSQMVNLLNKQTVNGLPSSAAIAGIYAKVDRERGVWKAPANVSLTGVVGPSLKITDAQQEGLNVHAEGGKSINAIRNFTGKGTLVWGARTLAGNDNEWRYIPVRRLFNMIEESTKKATEVFVFEPNNATTWMKVKAMIESYLFGLWQRGALAGPMPESAYFVNVGLGKTMTQDDILNGKMIVDIGIAAVRPAEFIILRFSHKMQEAA